MAVFGIKTTKDGNDTESTNPNDYTINSTYNTLKVSTEGTGEVEVPTGAGLTSVDIEHDLGYKPQFRIYVNASTTNDYYYQIPVYALTEQLSAGFEHTDTNTLRINLRQVSGSSMTVKYKYYIFIDPRKDAWYE